MARLPIVILIGLHFVSVAAFDDSATCSLWARISGKRQRNMWPVSSQGMNFSQCLHMCGEDEDCMAFSFYDTKWRTECHHSNVSISNRFTNDQSNLFTFLTKRCPRKMSIPEKVENNCLISKVFNFIPMAEQAFRKSMPLRALASKECRRHCVEDYKDRCSAYNIVKNQQDRRFAECQLFEGPVYYLEAALNEHFYAVENCDDKNPPVVPAAVHPDPSCLKLSVNEAKSSMFAGGVDNVAGAAGPMHCLLECQEDEQCTAAAFSERPTYTGHRCILYHDRNLTEPRVPYRAYDRYVVDSRTCPNASEVVPSSTNDYEWDLYRNTRGPVAPGARLRAKNVDTVEDCLAICADRLDCRAVDWNHSQNQCRLYPTVVAMYVSDADNFDHYVRKY